MDTFYKDFQDRFRGAKEQIASRLAVYLPFIAALKRIYPSPSAIDVGCGRGEWLEILLSEGFSPLGIDQDPAMIQTCAERNLPVSQGDGVAYLSSLPENSQALVSAFHVAEHLQFDQLRLLVSEAHRTLRPGGLLILETPNPENFYVATCGFNLDPTHRKPLPPQLLSFLPEFYGFTRNKVLRLQESVWTAANLSPSMLEVLWGASPDYAVVAQKAAPAEILGEFDELFGREYGLQLEEIARRFEDRLLKTGQAARGALAKAQEAARNAREAAEKAERTKAVLEDLYGSRSWRITAPLRWIHRTLLWAGGRALGWITFAPMSRPRRALRKVFKGLKASISRHPRLKRAVIWLLERFPKLRDRLRKGAAASRPEHRSTSVESFEDLSPEARKIYLNLKTAIEQYKKGRS